MMNTSEMTSAVNDTYMVTKTSTISTEDVSPKQTTLFIQNLSDLAEATCTHVPLTPAEKSCNESFLTPTAYLELDALSDDRAMTYMPVIFFLIIVMLFGIMGNILVLYIYGSDSKRKPANNFILTMAAFDLLASAIAIPLDIHDMRYHYTFYSHTACKIFRYSESAFTNASSFILILIAIDRYLKICRPLMPDSPLRSKVMCAGSSVFGFVIAIPTLWLFGINRRPIPSRRYCGFDCTVSDEYRNTKFNKYYFASLLTLFFVTLFTLVGIYIRIWVAIKTRRNSVIGDRASVSQSSVKSNDSKESRSFVKRKRNQSTTSDDDSVFTKSDSKQFLNHQQSSRRSRISRMGSSVSTMIGNVRCTRTTKIFIAVSVAFIACFLPSIIVNLLQAFVPSIQRTDSEVAKVIMKLLARVHFVNHAINPLIYSFLNVNFRKQCQKAYKRLAATCTAKYKRKSSISSRSSGSGSRKKPKNDSDAKTNEEVMEHSNHSQVETKNL